MDKHHYIYYVVPFTCPCSALYFKSVQVSEQESYVTEIKMIFAYFTFYVSILTECHKLELQYRLFCVVDLFVANFIPSSSNHLKSDLE